MFMKNDLIILIIIGVYFLYSIFSVKKSYYYYKNEPSFNSISHLSTTIAGVLIGIVFFILYLLGYVEL